MTPARQLRFWLIGLVLFGVVVWLLSGALMPFVAGAVIAYMLDPLADRLEHWGAPRWLAATLVLLAFVVLIVIALIVLMPMVIGQIGGFLSALPGYLVRLNAFLTSLIERLQDRLDMSEMQALRDQVTQNAGTAISWLGTVLGGIWRGGLALIDIISLLVITPVVAFYLLRDWDRMIATLDDFVPRQHLATVRALAGEVDRTLADFIRGQGLVCLILGTVYAVALSVAGLNFGLLVGLGAGLISFIPYVGSIVGLVISVGIALVQFDSPTMWLVIAGIFFAGQILEGYFLTPKLVGESVGLHPVWVLFALLAAGSLFGFTGILLAVPVAAVIGVVVRFLIRQYRASTYYQGTDDRGTEPLEPVEPPEPAARSGGAGAS